MTQEDMSIPEHYVLKVEGMTCGHCSARVEKAAQAVDGVRQARQRGALSLRRGEY